MFDVGETLVDETGMWERAAAAAGVPPFTLMGVLGGLAARGEHDARAWQILHVDRPASTWNEGELYPDALPCLRELRRRDLLVGVAGNVPAGCEEPLREHVDLLGSSGMWGVEKPAAEFFERIVAETGAEAAEIAYVGDRVDNDVVPALAAGMLRSLDELPEALGV